MIFDVKFRSVEICWWIWRLPGVRDLREINLGPISTKPEAKKPQFSAYCSSLSARLRNWHGANCSPLSGPYSKCNFREIQYFQGIEDPSGWRIIKESIGPSFMQNRSLECPMSGHTSCSDPLWANAWLYQAEIEHAFIWLSSACLHLYPYTSHCPSPSLAVAWGALCTP